MRTGDKVHWVLGEGVQSRRITAALVRRHSQREKDGDSWSVCHVTVCAILPCSPLPPMWMQDLDQCLFPREFRDLRLLQETAEGIADVHPRSHLVTIEPDGCVIHLWGYMSSCWTSKVACNRCIAAIKRIFKTCCCPSHFTLSSLHGCSLPSWNLLTPNRVSVFA